MAHTCEVCGEPAVVSVCDIRETEPVVSDGKVFANWERVGEPRHYCKKHRQPGKLVEGVDYTVLEKQA